MQAVPELSRQPESWAEQLLPATATSAGSCPPSSTGWYWARLPGGQPVLTALDALRALKGRRKVGVEEVPLELAGGVWRRLVVGADGTLNRRAYTFCVLERLRDALRRRDVYAPASSRWADPRTRLLPGPAWDAVSDQVCASLGHDPDPASELAAITAELDSAYRAVAGRLPANTAVRIETVAGRDRPVLTALDRLPELDSLTALRGQLTARLPRIDLPDLLLEVAGWTGLAAEFTHVTEGASRAADLHLSVCAVLIAEACTRRSWDTCTCRRCWRTPPALPARTWAGVPS